MKRLRKLGIADFETIHDTRRRQDDMLRRLKKTDVDEGYYVGFAKCRADHCNRTKCAEACWFGDRRRWARDTVAAYKLLKKLHGVLYEVRIIRQSWERPLGKLNRVSIGAMKQFHRRCLDGLYNAKVVAIGACKVLPRRDTWVVGVHGIVAGVDREDLERIFSVRRELSGFSNNSLGIDEVKDLPSTIVNVLSNDLQTLCPENLRVEALAPKKIHRTEYYRWRLRLNVGELRIRYGCDRYYNSLKKEPRPYQAKKGRPRPVWLEPFWYGSHDPRCTCNICKNQKG